MSDQDVNLLDAEISAWVARLAADAPASADQIEQALRQIASLAVNEERQRVLSSLMTADEVAGRLGISTSATLARAKKRNVGMRFGQGGWMRLFLPEDVNRLRPMRRGRPKKQQP